MDTKRSENFLEELKKSVNEMTDRDFLIGNIKRDLYNLPLEEILANIVQGRYSK